jgi:hypothetical protein
VGRVNSSCARWAAAAFFSSIFFTISSARAQKSVIDGSHFASIWLWRTSSCTFSAPMTARDLPAGTTILPCDKGIFKGCFKRTSFGRSSAGASSGFGAGAGSLANAEIAIARKKTSSLDRCDGWTEVSLAQILDHTCDLIDPGEVAEIKLQRRVIVMLSRAGLAVGMKPVSNRCGGLLNFIVGRYCPAILRRSFALLASWIFLPKEGAAIVRRSSSQCSHWRNSPLKRPRFGNLERRDNCARRHRFGDHLLVTRITGRASVAKQAASRT